jgi:hypothetical protein
MLLHHIQASNFSSATIYLSFVITEIFEVQRYNSTRIQNISNNFEINPAFISYSSK